MARKKSTPAPETETAALTASEANSGNDDNISGRKTAVFGNDTPKEPTKEPEPAPETDAEPQTSPEDFPEPPMPEPETTPETDAEPPTVPEAVSEPPMPEPRQVPETDAKPPTTPSAFVLKRLLKVSKPLVKGEDVKAVQLALIGRNLNCGIEGANGIYGASTAQAVRRFQSANRLIVDGKVGKFTIAVLGGVWEN